MAIRVLIVDDEIDHAEILAEMMSLWGHGATVATSVAAALTQLDSESFDLILVDFMLPDGSGDRIVAQLRARNVRTRIVATTALGTKHEREWILSSGVDDFLLKPFTMAQVKAQVDLVTFRGDP